MNFEKKKKKKEYFRFQKHHREATSNIEIEVGQQCVKFFLIYYNQKQLITAVLLE